MLNILSIPGKNNMSFDPNTELLEMYYEKGLDEGLSPEAAELYARQQMSNNT